MSGPPYDPALLRQVAGEIVSTARELAARGWTPATSSNFSMRLDEAHAAITVSGLDKGRLTEDGVMAVDLDGRPVATEQRPSAETVLHTRLYRRDAGIGCVLHTLHSLVPGVRPKWGRAAGGLRAGQGDRRDHDARGRDRAAGPGPSIAWSQSMASRPWMWSTSPPTARSARRCARSSSTSTSTRE
jgi:class II aldolase/adducin N-terminal domain-containing protein